MKKKRILICLAMLIVIGILWQTIMNKIEKSKYPSVGDFFDNGSYKICYQLQGEGECVFVFIPGSGTPCAYTDFYGLQKELVNKGMTLTFDQSGSGWSTKAKTDRTVEHLCEELNALLEEVVPEKKIILISHSLGGLEAIFYSQNYGDKVKGIVFLDSGSPEFYANDSELTAILLNRGIAFARSIGLIRLSEVFGISFPIYGNQLRNRQLPSDLQQIDQYLLIQQAGNIETLHSVSLMNENAQKVLDGEKLNQLPVLVLSSDSGNDWQQTQQQLAAWSNQSEIVLIENASHYIHWADTEQVIERIQLWLNEIE